MRVTGGTGSGFIENTGRRPMLKSVGGRMRHDRIDESPRLRSRERLRAELARQVAEYERRNGPVQTTPTIKRSPDTRVDLVIRADVEDKRAAQNRQQRTPSRPPKRQQHMRGCDDPRHH